MAPQLHIGTCAWSFDSWHGVFYPPRLPAAGRLAWYARHLQAVEVDSTFYRIPSPSTVAHWADVTPAGFRFACKMPREITHDRRMRDADGVLHRFLVSMEPLGEKLGPIVIQFPPSLTPEQDGAVFHHWVQTLPSGFSYAVEFRHRAWHTAHWAHLLEKHGIAWVWSDVSPLTDMTSAALGFWPETAAFLYVRLLGDLGTKYGPDGRTVHRYHRRLWSRVGALDLWATRIRSHLDHARTVYLFANNHFEGYSPQTCQDVAGRLGLAITLPDAEHLRTESPESPQMQLF